VAALVLALLVTTATAFAQTGGGYDLTWSTIDGGGGRAVQSLSAVDSQVAPSRENNKTARLIAGLL
jgi:hypothetical protein